MIDKQRSKYDEKLHANGTLWGLARLRPESRQGKPATNRPLPDPWRIVIVVSLHGLRMTPWAHADPAVAAIPACTMPACMLTNNRERGSVRADGQGERITLMIGKSPAMSRAKG